MKSKSKMNPLKRARARSKMTLEELQVKSGVDAATITAVENGHRLAYPTTLAKLAEALNCDLDDFEELIYSGTKESGKGRKTNLDDAKDSDNQDKASWGGPRAGSGRKLRAKPLAEPVSDEAGTDQAQIVSDPSNPGQLVLAGV